MEEQLEQSGKEKPRHVGEEKEKLAETENNLVVGIPLIAGIRPVVVQPRAVIIAFHVEDVRVAVGVGIVRRAVRVTARLIPK